MTRQQIKDLREYVRKHEVRDDRAMVQITARQLQELLDMAEEYLDNGGWG